MSVKRVMATQTQIDTHIDTQTQTQTQTHTQLHNYIQYMYIYTSVALVNYN